MGAEHNVGYNGAWVFVIVLSTHGNHNVFVSPLVEPQLPSNAGLNLQDQELFHFAQSFD